MRTNSKDVKKKKKSYWQPEKCSFFFHFYLVALGNGFVSIYVSPKRPFVYMPLFQFFFFFLFFIPKLDVSEMHKWMLEWMHRKSHWNKIYVERSKPKSNIESFQYVLFFSWPLKWCIFFFFLVWALCSTLFPTITAT